MLALAIATWRTRAPVQHFIATNGYIAIFILMVAESDTTDNHTDSDRAARAPASDGPGYRKAG
jgi:hypothetical protein